jgi:hypothetical protein
MGCHLIITVVYKPMRSGIACLDAASHLSAVTGLFVEAIGFGKIY